MELQNSVKLFLKAKHIVVPDDWIVACIDWVFSDNPQLKRENSRAVAEKVFEQWLYSDLTELGTSCLPLGLAQQRLTTVSGYFPVQVNQVRDVGQPAYAQLQKVQKADTQNASVSAEQQHQPVWEPRPSRMLLMQITDGTSVVRVMEYRAIPILSQNIKPGTKILLFGSITSRRGTLLLRQEQVQMLGGEVEALSVPNAVENVLARCLRLEESENPQEYEETCDPTQIGVSQASQYYPSQMSSAYPKNNSAQPPPPPPALSQATECIRGVLASTAAIHNLDEMEDEDFLDADVEAALSQIECQASPSSHSGQNGFLSKTSHESSSDCTRSGDHNRVNSRSGNVSDSLSGNGMDTIINDMDIDESIFNDDFYENLTVPSGTQTSRQQSQRSMGVDNSFRQQASTSGTPIRPTNNFSPQPHWISSRHPAQWSKQNSSSTITTSSSSKTCNINTATKSSKQSTTPLAVVKPKTQQTSLHNFLQKLPEKDPVDQCTSSKDNPEECWKNAIQNTQNRTTSIVQPGIPYDVVEKKGGMTVERSVSERVQEELPFTYLCFLRQSSSVAQEVVVKGFIMTLVSRMEQTAGRWCLRVLINDSTASKEVDIASEVLEGLIGLSVEELGKKKAEAKSNSEIKAVLAKRLSGCQQKLISLCCLFHLHLDPSLPRPILTALTQITPSQAHQLHLRSNFDAK